MTNVEAYLKSPTERVDDLLCNGLKIIQDKNSYCFSIDAVLLSNFVRAGKKDRIIDLGTGSGVIPLLLSAKTEAPKIVGIEMLEEVAERAERSVLMNNLKGRVKIICGDLKEAPRIFGRESFTVVVTNPPYMRMDEGKISPKKDIAIARHEVAATLEDVVNAAAGLLTFGGKFYMVYRTWRLTDAIFELKNRALEPKLLRFIQPRAADPPNLFLVLAQKGAGSGLKILPPLVVYNDDGNYTEEINRIYFEDLKSSSS
ncbi:methyltransferase domain-containing protein [Biomaibacter acetigenes]|uniref:Methyltransferase domain-containing protein n=1 Tax=Biomaibacter acetigenes TaxID=2316383 RepID=A0A3G2R1R4_9FIRM|nr:tRNA1(Val) (adenine(37)-N6)-methyltransferase [Biomaibacter acetigenes]AYO29225.1 methyltransferase domain-containing protein [Biomaibacter acetigenes]RKL64544.1 tRNA1(Val) (adenine(37)-N6)-methyltransferase [Thermoanaerobacteraceae bacterium SP2]